jgi:hypothetical protein
MTLLASGPVQLQMIPTVIDDSLAFACVAPLVTAVAPQKRIDVRTMAETRKMLRRISILPLFV